MKVLASRILQAEREKQHSEQAADRKSQVGSGDRSERIRTYNFPQGRVTDHRVNLTLYSLDRFMDGDIEGMIDALAAQAQAEPSGRKPRARDADGGQIRRTAGAAILFCHGEDGSASSRRRGPQGMKPGEGYVHE